MDASAAEPLYSAYLELSQDSGTRSLEEVKRRMDGIEANLAERGLNTRENFELMVMLLSVTEAITGKMLVWKLLDQHAQEPREKEKR